MSCSLTASSMGGKAVLKTCFTSGTACYCRDRDQVLPNPCHFWQQRYQGRKQAKGWTPSVPKVPSEH